jgi:pyridoxal phosphate enzyme (YggS family)
MSDASRDEIGANLARVRDRVTRAAERAGRSGAEVLLVAVSKTATVERIRAAIAAGVPALGENRVQEAREKIRAIGRLVPWHLVGSLQTNKVKDALLCFDLIHSIDRLSLAEALSARATREGRRVEGLVQVNVAEEPQKMGLSPAELGPALEAMQALPGLVLRGLMTIPPLPSDPEESRPHYRALRKLLVEAQGWGMGAGFRELSMGMSGDFEVAAEEGATMVRVGTAIFGARGH